MTRYREDLDVMRCGDPGCTHVGHDGLHLLARCHDQYPPACIYRGDGVLVFECIVCKAVVAEVAVASRAEEDADVLFEVGLEVDEASLLRVRTRNVIGEAFSITLAAGPGEEEGMVKLDLRVSGEVPGRVVSSPRSVTGEAVEFIGRKQKLDS